MVANSETKYVAHSLPMEEIYADASFNCRGEIPAHEIIALAADIKARGLDVPIVVQPYTMKTNPKIKYRVVAGHRRHKAFMYNVYTNVPGAEVIPAFIRTDLDEMGARQLNLRENLHRQNLNILQEATALKFFLDCKGPTGIHLFNDAELGELFGQSRGWVQNRRELLRLPREIQLSAASGLLTNEHIKRLVKMRSDVDRFELVRKIKDMKARGEKIDLTPSVQRSTDVHRTRARKTGEITEMSGLVYDILGPNIASRFAAWSAGVISTVALLDSIKEYCHENGIEYKQPAFIRQALTGVVSAA